MAAPVTTDEFERLYRDTARDVFAYVRRRTARDAEDLVAETYAVAWRRRADLPPPMLRRAWLFGVARRLLAADARRRARDGDLGRELGQEHAGAPPGERTAAVVAAALDRLPPAEAEILRLVGWEGLTPAELAVALGVRPGTARVRLHRARRSLAGDPEVRALVDGDPPDGPDQPRCASTASSRG